MFFTNYVQQCNKNNISPSAAAEAMGFQRSAVTRWSKGTEPRFATLQKIAKFFNCSVEDLTGKKEEPNTVADDELSEDQRLLIDKLLAMTPEELEKKLPAIRVILEL